MKHKQQFSDITFQELVFFLLIIRIRIKVLGRQCNQNKPKTLLEMDETQIDDCFSKYEQIRRTRKHAVLLKVERKKKHPGVHHYHHNITSHLHKAA